MDPNFTLVDADGDKLTLYLEPDSYGRHELEISLDGSDPDNETTYYIPLTKAQLQELAEAINNLDRPETKVPW